MFCKKSRYSENFMDIVEEIVVIIESDCKVSMINRKGLELLGYPENEVVGKDWFDNFIPERIKEDVRSVFDKIMKGEIRHVEYFENPIRTKDGKELLISWHNMMLLDENNRITGTLSAGIDITELDRLKKKVKELEAKLK